jgi:uncharacterized peroxidase-related enzyme
VLVDDWNLTDCVVAHGALLRVYSKDPTLSERVAANFHKAGLTPRQVAVVEYARKVSREAELVTAADHVALTAHGYSSRAIWEIGAISACVSNYKFIGVSGSRAALPS